MIRGREVEDMPEDALTGRHFKGVVNHAVSGRLVGDVIDNAKK
jgi:hypothetical protein